MRMPFGKHRGEKIETLDHGYLLWILRNVADLDPILRYEIQRALELHDDNDPQPVAMIGRDIADDWFRTLSMEFHPDRGGTHEGMKAINRGYELLLELVG